MNAISHGILAFTCIIILVSCEGQKHQLPGPGGDYSTGVTLLSFTDSSRKELFDNSGASFRSITVKAWYPSDSAGEAAPYFENPEAVMNSFGFPELYRDLLTNAGRDIPVSTKEKSFPVLIFSHGWGEHFSQNTLLMEELASHGFVVFSIAHHFECKFSFYPDGKWITLDPGSDRFRKIMEEQQQPEAMEIYRQMFSLDSDSARMQVFARMNQLMPLLFRESPSYWAEDINFLVGSLEELNNHHPIFRNKLDCDRLGVLGMSMGGIATNEVCLSNRKVKAGVNIDGGIYGSLTDTVMNTPFMFLNSQRYLGYGGLFVSKSMDECYSITIRNSDHYNFSDYALYPMKEQMLLGTIDAEIPIGIMNSAVVAFFDRYLNKAEAKALNKIAGNTSVEFVSGAK